MKWKIERQTETSLSVKEGSKLGGGKRLFKKGTAKGNFREGDQKVEGLRREKENDLLGLYYSWKKEVLTEESGARQKGRCEGQQSTGIQKIRKGERKKNRQKLLEKIRGVGLLGEERTAGEKVARAEANWWRENNPLWREIAEREGEPTFKSVHRPRVS